MSTEAVMGREGLFEDLPEVPAPQSAGASRPRLRQPVRDQVELRAVDLASVVAAEGPVRVIWASVDGLDLAQLSAPIKSGAGRLGHTPHRTRRSRWPGQDR